MTKKNKQTTPKKSVKSKKTAPSKQLPTSEINTEQLILEAAEAEFLENGYANAKTTAIAKRAGVTHALLHYYFRKKENLFQNVFQNKVQLIGDSLYQSIHDKRLSFEEVIRRMIEVHFDFLNENPKLFSFIYNEITTNEVNKLFLIEQMRPKMENVIGSVEKLLAKEIRKRNVREIKVADLFLNMIALNVITFMALSVADDLIPNKNSKSFKTLVKQRKESNVQFVLNALKTEKIMRKPSRCC